MLATVGVRTLRSFVRFSHGLLRRKKPPCFWNNTATSHQTSSLPQAFSTTFINSLCTKVEAGNTEKLNTENKSIFDGVEVSHHNNNHIDIQNNQEKSPLSAEKDSSSCTSNVHSDRTLSSIGSDVKEKDLDILPSNSDTISKTYPTAVLPRFQLPEDLKQNKGTAPGIKFPGDIFVIKNHKDEFEHKDVLESFLDEEALGFDTEHCPVKHDVCVVQLASKDKAVLWQCMNFKRKMPPYLKEILTGRVAKVGHACVDDAIMIFKQFNVEPTNLIDTNSWARDLQCSHQSLQGVCGIFLHAFLSKKHQKSNWNKANLSPGQIRYAATDAWISLRVYQEMKRHGEELGVALTPIYKTLQQWYTEVKDNQRLRRKRRRQRIKEQKQELLFQIESVTQGLDRNSVNDKDNYASTEWAVMQETPSEGETSLVAELEEKISITNEIVNDKNNQISDVEYSDEEEKNEREDKQSKGSRRRRKKFLAKFHPLE